MWQAAPSCRGQLLHAAVPGLLLLHGRGIRKQACSHLSSALTVEAVLRQAFKQQVVQKVTDAITSAQKALQDKQDDNSYVEDARRHLREKQAELDRAQAAFDSVYQPVSATTSYSSFTFCGTQTSDLAARRSVISTWQPVDPDAK
jgi:hypothetical protein